jgi:thymidylate kinase
MQHPLPAPAVTIYLDIAPETGVRRKSSGRDLYERDLSLLVRVRASYRRQAAQPDWVLVNAELPPDDVADVVMRAIQPRLSPSSNPARS